MMKQYIYIIGIAMMMAACGQKTIVEKTQSEQSYRLQSGQEYTASYVCAVFHA